MRLLPLLLLVACEPTTGIIDTEPEELGFCEQISDGGSYQTEQGVGGNDAAGDLYIRVITTEDEDIRNPLYIAFKDYTLENINTGGVQQTGQTSSDGIASLMGLGPGSWAFHTSFSRGSRICVADITVPVQVNATTTGCVVMDCPQ